MISVRYFATFSVSNRHTDRSRFPVPFADPLDNHLITVDNRTAESPYRILTSHQATSRMNPVIYFPEGWQSGRLRRSTFRNPVTLSSTRFAAGNGKPVQGQTLDRLGYGQYAVTGRSCFLLWSGAIWRTRG
jgi:hypothetical protein